MTEKVNVERAKEALTDGVQKTKAGLETAKGKISEVSQTVKEGASKAGTVVKEGASKAGTVVKDRASVAAEGLREGYGKARKDLDKLAEDVTAYVRDNPGRAVVMAGALGFFLGLLIRGDRRRR